MKKLGILSIWGVVLGAGVAAVWWFTQDPFLTDVRVVRGLGAMGSAPEAQVEVARLLQSAGSPAVLLWGQFPDDREALDVLNEFWKDRGAESAAPTDKDALRWDEIWLDEGFHDLLPGRPVHLRGADVALVKELESLRAEGRTVLIVTAPPFAASVLKGSPAAGLARSPLVFQSLLWLEGPRRHEDEEGLRPPCRLPHADLQGTGPLGCRLLQSARGAYRRHFKPGQRLMQVERLSDRDWLVWRATEPSF